MKVSCYPQFLPILSTEVLGKEGYHIPERTKTASSPTVTVIGVYPSASLQTQKNIVGAYSKQVKRAPRSLKTCGIQMFAEGLALAIPLDEGVC